MLIGYLAGLVGGVALSTFSKTLALLFGMLVFGVQVSFDSQREECDKRAERRADGESVHGVKRIQRYPNITNTEIREGDRSAVCIGR